MSTQLDLIPQPVSDAPPQIVARPYQVEAKTAIFEQWNNVRATLLVLPTGTGKTVVFSLVTRDIVASGGNVLILAHRGELLAQAADKLERTTGLGAALEKAENEAHETLYSVTVGSVQTLQRRSRLERFDPQQFSHIIIDEAHHATSDSYGVILDYFADAKVLGVTATPDRHDRKNLGGVFESLAYELSLLQAIKDGYLSPIRALSIPLQIDFTKVSTKGGDFDERESAEALDPYLHDIARHMKEHCTGRKTLVFLPLIATAEKFADILTAAGFRAGWISGVHEERAQILKDYAAGKYDVLCNSMLLTEGFDDPATDCIVCLRPTKSRPLYAQIVGRGTRLYPGKENLLLLDFLWMTDRHELCRPAHLIAETQEIADKMTEATQAAGAEGMEIDEDLLDGATSSVVKDREEKLAEELKAQRAKQKKLVDPLQYAVSINAEDLLDYAPSFGWEAGPATEKQLAALEKAGIANSAVPNAGYAQKLLDRLTTRRADGYASPKQVKTLERFGFAHAGNMKFEDANKTITRIAANSWRLPADLYEVVAKQRSERAAHLQPKG